MNVNVLYRRHLVLPGIMWYYRWLYQQRWRANLRGMRFDENEIRRMVWSIETIDIDTFYIYGWVLNVRFYASRFTIRHDVKPRCLCLEPRVSLRHVRWWWKWLAFEYRSHKIRTEPVCGRRFFTCCRKFLIVRCTDFCVLVVIVLCNSIKPFSHRRPFTIPISLAFRINFTLFVIQVDSLPFSKMAASVRHLENIILSSSCLNVDRFYCFNVKTKLVNYR